MRAETGGSQERARAARLIHGVVYGGKTTDQMFGQSAIRPLISELVYGTLRYYFVLEPLVARHLDRPLKTRDLDVRCLLLVGAYQLHYTRVPDHAAINETVNACRALKKPWARGLVNAILRKVREEKPDERSFGLPSWIRDRLVAAYTDEMEALGRASLDRAPMCLRVNVSRTDPESYQQMLSAAGIGYHAGWLPEGLVLASPVPVRQLPGHAQGLVSVQDAGAQFAAALMAAAGASGPVLDACAAPGGKLFHLAERLPDVPLYALERAPARFEQLQREAQRLGHERVHLLLGDATNSAWRTGPVPERFSAILCDAPCSGTGTLRRHPEVKILRKPDDLAGYIALQQRLLENLWGHLEVGGTFLYCTCSLLPEENDEVIETFLSATPDAEVVPIRLPTGRPMRHGWQLLPLPTPKDHPDRSVDGFYFARLTRRVKMRAP